MDRYWSTYVQKTEELYESRALRFRDDNKELWLKILQISNGMNVLEVGCGGGVFCHRVKTYLPDTKVTGLDFDVGHIEYAKSKSAKLNLDCKFIAGDAADLPFYENTFDVCFSHTVMNFCEPNSFVSEQFRVLKPGGKIIILCVINSGNKPESWVPTEDCEEKDLFDRLWSQASKNDYSNVKKYVNDEHKYFEYLSKSGFRDVSVDALAVVAFAPDSANVSTNLAISQINEDRLSELSSIEKARRMAPEALTDNEYNLMIRMINRRYDKKIIQYKNGEKTWDYRVSTMLAISGTK